MNLYDLYVCHPCDDLNIVSMPVNVMAEDLQKASDVAISYAIYLGDRADFYGRTIDLSPNFSVDNSKLYVRAIRSRRANHRPVNLYYKKVHLSEKCPDFVKKTLSLAIEDNVMLNVCKDDLESRVFSFD